MIFPLEVLNLPLKYIHPDPTITKKKKKNALYMWEEKALEIFCVASWLFICFKLSHIYFKELMESNRKKILDWLWLIYFLWFKGKFKKVNEWRIHLFNALSQFLWKSSMPFQNENTGVVYIHVFVASCTVSRTKAGNLFRCEIDWPSEALPEFTCKGDVHIIAFNLRNEGKLIHSIWTNMGLYITYSLSRTKQNWRGQCKGVKMIFIKSITWINLRWRCTHQWLSTCKIKDITENFIDYFRSLYSRCTICVTHHCRQSVR